MSSLQGRKILLVEDSVDNQLLIERFLAAQGAVVETASDGKEGVEKALNSDYELIIMDIQMPILDGRSATKQLRQKGYKQPIIALTAHAMKEDRSKCLEAGCTDYLTKPISPRVLTETVAKYLK